MLRGKFGQIGKQFRDGHITMDAFEQAAFRDHIRSGERIMYLASMGKLKHKRTRNTIAAEPTPRSSCPSGADATAARAPRTAASDPRDSTSSNASRASDPVPQGPNNAARLGSALADVHSTEAKPVEPEHGKTHHNADSDSSPRSHPRLLMSTAYRQEDDLDDDNQSTSKSPAARRPTARVTSSDRRKLGSVRPQSAGPAGRRPRSPGVGVLHRTAQDETAAKRRAVAAAADVPLQVGPEILAPSAVGRVERCRPASAGGNTSDHPHWRAGQQSPTRVGHRGFGAQGRGGGGRNSGRGGRRGDRGVPRESRGAVRRTPNARVPGGDSTARTLQGSFAESVIKSACPLAAYDGITATTKARPKSAGAARAPAPAFDPGSHEPHALAAGARLLPVGAIHRAFKGRLLAAVQAWDPHTAAAVRAARAETLLRQHGAGRTGHPGAPKPAAASDQRRRGVSGVQGKTGDGAARGRDERGGRRRAGSSSAPRRMGRGRGGDAVGDAARKDSCRGRARQDIAQAVSVIDGAPTGGHGSGTVEGGAKTLDPAELEKFKLGHCSSRPSTADGSSCRGSTRGSPRGSARSNSGATLSTARASAATGYSSSRGGGGDGTSSRAASHRSASTSHSHNCSTSRPDEIAAEEKRARLVAKLEALRRRMADAEGLLREVDSCLQPKPKPKRRPGTASSRPTTNPSRRQSSGTGRSLAVTPGNTSAKSSAGYGAFNLGERRMCPLVVTHPANAFPEELRVSHGPEQRHSK